MTIIKTKN